MASSVSLKRILVQSLLLLSHALTLAATPLQSCLASASVVTYVQGDSSWVAETTPWQLRFVPEPAAVCHPTNKFQFAAALACARNSSVTVSPLAGGHSFVAFGFCNPGNLVVNLAAFNSASYGAGTQLLTVGGGVRVGPAMKYLWNTAGRHFPHVRHGHVGFAGSVIGGGFGSTSRFLGTPMDYLTCVEIMLYNGTIVNAAAGSDLFWATWKPTYPNVVSFTLKIGNKTLDAGIKPLLAIQDFGLNVAPNTFVFRWNLSAAPYSGYGYFYGDPAAFDAMILPLKNSLTALNAQPSISKSQHEFWAQEVIIAPGADSTGGGSSSGRSFYIQALTLTTQYGKNLWLIRLDINAADSSKPFPSDGVQWGKNLMIPFENALTAAGIPLRGFANYRDTALSEPQWSSRLYGANYPKLKL